MPWGRMDDKFHRNSKVRELRRARGGRDALGAWVYWWSWCLDDPELTGFVPADELPAADLKAAELLVKVGLWDECEGGYMFHDFNHYNPTKRQVEDKKEADRIRAAEKRAAEKLANRSKSTSESKETSHATPERESFELESTRVPIPSHPVPSHSQPLPPVESGPRPDLDSGVKIRPAAVGRPSASQRMAAQFEAATLTLKREQIGQLFSEARQATGKGSYRLKYTDDDLADSAIAWALSDHPSDPGRACVLSIANYFAHCATEEGSRRFDAWAFSGWAKDPGKWFAHSAVNGRRNGPGEVSTEFDPSQNEEWANG
jgi:hypothetical protein